jgi:hypothetical protein
MQRPNRNWRLGKMDRASSKSEISPALNPPHPGVVCEVPRVCEGDYETTLTEIALRSIPAQAKIANQNPNPRANHVNAQRSLRDIANRERRCRPAIGQYIVYRTLLQEVEPERELYMAVGDEVFKSFFTRKSVQLILARNRIKLLIVKLDAEEIESWTS